MCDPEIPKLYFIFPFLATAPFPKTVRDVQVSQAEPKVIFSPRPLDAIIPELIIMISKFRLLLQNVRHIRVH